MKVAKHLKVLYIAGVLLITMGYDLHCYASGCMLPGSTILGEAPDMGLAGGYLLTVQSPRMLLGCFRGRDAGSSSIHVFSQAGCVLVFIVRFFKQIPY